MFLKVWKHISAFIIIYWFFLYLKQISNCRETFFLITNCNQVNISSHILVLDYLWLMSVRNLELLRLGNCNFSRNSGFASINFLSSSNMIALADLVSPYLESCSFSLLQQERHKQYQGTKLNLQKQSEKLKIQKDTWNFQVSGDELFPWTTLH